MRHNWLGNIRELENAIHHALLVCNDGVIRPVDLQRTSGPEVAAPIARHESGHQPPQADLEGALSDIFERGGDQLFKGIENRVFLAAFEYCQRNQVQTVKLLGISRNIVRARLIRISAIGNGSIQPQEGVLSPPSDIQIQ